MDITKNQQQQPPPAPRSAADDSPLEIMVAVLIAIVTVIGAIVIWRAAVANDGANDADFVGLGATLNAQEAQGINSVEAYDEVAAFTDYKRYSELSQLIMEDMEEARSVEARRLAIQAAEADQLAFSSEDNFHAEFVMEDGTYNLERQLRELWADASQERDLNPRPHFARADALRTKGNRFLAMEMLLAMGLVFYTSVELVEERRQYLMTALGSFFALAGTVGALFIELSM